MNESSHRPPTLEDRTAVNSKMSASSSSSRVPPPEKCLSSHHSFRNARTTTCVRIRITDASSFLPKPCVPADVPTCLMDDISAERWERFAHDVNGEILEWRRHAQRVQWTTRLLVLAGLIFGITSIPLFLQSRHTNSQRRVMAAMVLVSFSAVCLVLTVVVVCRGATMERSARSDLVAILDWFSDETEDDPNHLNFELIKCREQERSHDGGEQVHTEDGSGRKPWAPIVYHYYIKVVVRGTSSMCGDADNASRCNGDEFGSDSDEDSGEVMSNLDREKGGSEDLLDAPVNSLEEPLLTGTSTERRANV